MRGTAFSAGSQGEWTSRVVEAGSGEIPLKKLRKPENRPAKSERRTRTAAGGLGQFPDAQLLPLQGKFSVFTGDSGGLITLNCIHCL